MAFIFTTVSTLNDMRRRGDAEDVKATLRRRSIPRFVRCGDDLVITVPGRFLPGGGISNICTPEMREWLNAKFEANNWQIPDLDNYESDNPEPKPGVALPSERP